MIMNPAKNPRPMAACVILIKAANPTCTPLDRQKTKPAIKTPTKTRPPLAKAAPWHERLREFRSVPGITLAYTKISNRISVHDLSTPPIDFQS